MKAILDETKTKISNDPELGKIQDKFIAKKYETSISYIAKLRFKLKIKASHIHDYPYATKIKNCEELKAKLGNFSDVCLAKEYHVSKERIRQIRAKYNISKYSKDREIA